MLLEIKEYVSRFSPLYCYSVVCIVCILRYKLKIQTFFLAIPSFTSCNSDFISHNSDFISLNSEFTSCNVVFCVCYEVKNKKGNCDFLFHYSDFFPHYCK